MDSTIQPVGANIIGPEEGSDAESVQLVFIDGVPLPFGDPNNPGQPIMLPTGAIRVSLTRSFGLQLTEKLREELEKLPEEHHSPIQVATSLTGVDRLAEVEQRLKGGVSR
jgi:hypothetical protein